jgi:quinone-modifying oxidoreductase subunit QmoC
MANTQRLQPDVQFVKELQQVGGDTLKKCYQCATCSVACPLSPSENPYPRKEMVWAQWGLKDRLVNDIDIWLCHNCGTCSDLCPRGAKPADLLAALRNMAYAKLASPNIIGKWMSSSKYLPILVGIPAVLWLIIWSIRAAQLGTYFPRFTYKDHQWVLDMQNGQIAYGGLFSGDFIIDPIHIAITLFVAWTFYKGVKMLFQSFDKGLSKTLVIGQKVNKSWTDAAKEVVVDQIVPHSKWKQCGYETEQDEKKFKGHLTLFYAFVALAIVTSFIAVAHWGGKVIDPLAAIGHTPLPLYHPIKWLAIIGAALMVYGLVKLTARRLNQDTEKHGSSYYDWYLLGVIWFVGLTGIFSFLLRLADTAVLAYGMYFLHLISIFMLFFYLPWSKLGHLVYRTAALIYARKVGRVPMQPKEDNTFVV